MNMTLDDLKRMANECRKVAIPRLKKYKADEVIDENKSVKWNREEVRRLNDLRYNELQKARHRMNACYEEFENATLNYIVEEVGVTLEKASKILEFVRGEKESSGLDVMLDFLDELLELFQ